MRLLASEIRPQGGIVLPPNNDRYTPVTLERPPSVRAFTASQQWHLRHQAGHNRHVRAQALRYLVVPESSGATTGCTTICHLFGHASLATVGCEASKTMYPRDRMRRVAHVSEQGGDCQQKGG